MAEQTPFDLEIELAPNPEPRCPCVLLLDVSRSMAGSRLPLLNEGLQAYRDELNADSLAVPASSLLDQTMKPGAALMRDQQRIEPRLDVNGNEIDDAIGDYRVDGGGEMYERHSPDTALLHLGAPRL